MINDEPRIACRMLDGDTELPIWPVNLADIGQASRPACLTEQQSHVMAAVAEGLLNTQFADRLIAPGAHDESACHGDFREAPG